MRIVFLSHDATNSGGAQICLLELVKGIKQLHPLWELYIIFPFEGNMLKDFIPYLSGFKVIKQPMWTYLPKAQRKRNVLFLSWRCIRSAWKIGLYLKTIKPDFVVTNTITIPSGAIAAKFLGYKHLWFIHEIPPKTKTINFLLNESLVVSLTNKLSKHVVTTSDYALSYYKQVGVKPSKIVRVYQSVEFTKPNNVSKPSECYTLALIGTFDSNKGQIELLKAIFLLVQRGVEVHCYLVGASDGSYTNEVKNYIHINKLEEKVTIVPYTPFPQSYYELVDVALNCSKIETFGRVTIEALKCGVPVIASNVGANTELVKDGYNGYLYEKGNIEDLADKIEKLSDKGLRNKLKKQFYPTVLSQFTREQFTHDFIDVLLM